MPWDRDGHWVEDEEGAPYARPVPARTVTNRADAQGAVPFTQARRGNRGAGPKGVPGVNRKGVSPLGASGPGSDRAATDDDPPVGGSAGQPKALDGSGDIAGFGGGPGPEPPVDPDEVVYDRNALVLGGGGAKAAFQVGALRYLYRYHDFAPAIITGASAGALNAAKLAEGPKPLTPFFSDPGAPIRELETLWRGIRANEDVYVESEEYHKQLRDLRAAADAAGDIEALLTYSVYVSLISVAWGPVAAVGMIGHAYFGLQLKNTLELIRDRLEAAGTAAPSIESFNDQHPLGLLLEHIDPERVASSGIALRVSTVDLFSGELRYVNECGVVEDKDGAALDASFQDETPSVRRGVLASAALPMFFRPVAIGAGEGPPIGLKPVEYRPLVRRGFVDAEVVGGAPDATIELPADYLDRLFEEEEPLIDEAEAWPRWYWDGGIRENVPVRKTLQLGATHLTIVVTTPMAFVQAYPETLPSAVLGRRAIQLAEILTNEVTRGDLEMLRTLDDLRRVANAASTSVLDPVKTVPLPRHASGEVITVPEYTLITPPVPLGPSVDFIPELISDNIELGEMTARHVLSQAADGVARIEDAVRSREEREAEVNDWLLKKIDLYEAQKDAFGALRDLRDAARRRARDELAIANGDPYTPAAEKARLAAALEVEEQRLAEVERELEKFLALVELYRANRAYYQESTRA